MADPAAIDLSSGARRHLARLGQRTPLLADLSQADVLVLVPHAEGFETITHVRPINARTVYPIDQVGTVLRPERRPLLTHAFQTGEIHDGGVFLRSHRRWIRTLAVPVRYRGDVIAVLAREFSPSIEAMPGNHELVVFKTSRRLASMVAEGSYPFGAETRTHDHPPRAGDGVMLFDHRARLEYASPNALSVLRQVGVQGLAQRLDQMGIDAPGIHEAYAKRLDYTDEIELESGVLSTYCVPLLEAEKVTGALVLVRNITELRQRDRLLLTKDATITEIHHRVKNNLQTISSLLHLQSRRVDSPAAKTAIDESVRRIRAIGLVHELLSQRTDDEVEFTEIVRTLTTSVRDSLIDPQRPVSFTLDVEPLRLPSNMTTPMALIISELAQNALDHSECTEVTIELHRSTGAARLRIADDGVGFSDEILAGGGRNLGLTIVETIARTELGGTIEFGRGQSGAVITIDIPLYSTPRETSRPAES